MNGSTAIAPRGSLARGEGRADGFHGSPHRGNGDGQGGGTTAIRADVRIVAATNRDLGAAIAAGTFRRDLYYRLHVFPIGIPPLRAPPLCRVSDTTLARLEAHAWPGNVRELQNVIERSVIMSESDVFSIDEGWLSRGAREVRPPGPGESNVTVEEIEREAIFRALRSANWMVGGANGAAAILGLKRTTLQGRILKLGIERCMA